MGFTSFFKSVTDSLLSCVRGADPAPRETVESGNRTEGEVINAERIDSGSEESKEESKREIVDPMNDNEHNSVATLPEYTQSDVGLNAVASLSDLTALSDLTDSVGTIERASSNVTADSGVVDYRHCSGESISVSGENDEPSFGPYDALSSVVVVGATFSGGYAPLLVNTMSGLSGASDRYLDSVSRGSGFDSTPSEGNRNLPEDFAKEVIGNFISLNTGMPAVDSMANVLEGAVLASNSISISRPIIDAADFVFLAMADRVQSGPMVLEENDTNEERRAGSGSGQREGFAQALVRERSQSEGDRGEQDTTARPRSQSEGDVTERKLKAIKDTKLLRSRHW